MGVAAVKYWVIDNDALHEADGDEPDQYGDLVGLASRLAVGDGVLRALYDTVSQSANIVALGRVESVDPNDGTAAIDWQSVEFSITPGPNGRRHWEQKPYFMLNSDRALAYELPPKFATAFDDRDRLGSSVPTEELEEEVRREAASLVWPLVSRGFSVGQIVDSTLLSRSAVVEARTAWMVEKRSDGASLQQIADVVGITRQRVSQLFQGVGLTGASEARARLRDQSRLGEVLQAERLRGLIRDVAESMPGSGVDEIAREVGVSQSVVRRHLTRMGSKLVCDTRHSGQKAIWSNEQLLDVLRIASTKSTPLTVAAYNALVTQKQVEGPTGQVFYMRFGSWLEACEAAGVQSGERVRGNYTRAWLNVDLEALVVEFLFSIEHDGSFGDFQSWLRERPDSPSVATVRSRLGTWNEMKRNAIEQIVASGRLTELLDVCE